MRKPAAYGRGNRPPRLGDFRGHYGRAPDGGIRQAGVDAASVSRGLEMDGGPGRQSLVSHDAAFPAIASGRLERRGGASAPRINRTRTTKTGPLWSDQFGLWSDQFGLDILGLIAEHKRLDCGYRLGNRDFNRAILFKFQEHIAIRERAQTLANKETRAPLHQTIHGLENIDFGLGVECA